MYRSNKSSNKKTLSLLENSLGYIKKSVRIWQPPRPLNPSNQPTKIIQSISGLGAWKSNEISCLFFYYPLLFYLIFIGPCLIMLIFFCSTFMIVETGTSANSPASNNRSGWLSEDRNILVTHSIE